MTLRPLLASLVLALAPVPACAALRVVTTTEDLAALASAVGGDLVEVEPIARGYQDPHFVEAKPSYLLKLKRADLYVQVGLELEVGWAPSLLTNARNPKILPGNPGFLEASEGCDILEKPTGAVDRSQGDVHPQGNPHYWLDPSNGRVIAQHIAGRLAELDPGHAKEFSVNLARFEALLAEKEKEWEKTAAPLKGLKAVTYHRSWTSFAKRFGIEVVDFVETRPGIPPSPSHLQALRARIRKDGVRLLIAEPYFDDKLPRKIAADTGVPFIVLPPSVGGDKAIGDYPALFDHALKLLADALAAPAKT